MESGEITRRDTAVIPTPNGVVPWRPVMGTPLNQCPTNIDASTMRGRALLLAAGNPGDIEFDKNGRAEICATHWLVYPDEGENPETGEIGTYCRVVFFDSSGRTFRTTAAHGPSRLKAALEIFDPPDWIDGITFVITRRLGKRDRWYHDIRLHERYMEGE